MENPGARICLSGDVLFGRMGCLLRWFQALLRKAWVLRVGHDRAGRAGGYACPAHATRVGYGLRPARDGFRNRGTGIPTVPSAPSWFVWVRE